MNFINSISNDNVTTVSFKDSRIFDETCIIALGDELIEVATRSEPGQNVLIDFSNVNYLSSAALGKLITMNKRLKEKGCNLKLLNISSNIMEIFEITRLDRFFTIEKN